jgi:soluble lytic murein transglycosylase-like protein
VGTAALTAALTLAAARHGGADIYTRRNQSGTIEATNLPPAADFRLAYRSKPTTLIPSPSPTARRSSNTDFDDHINAAAGKHGVSVDLVRAIIQVESGFDHLATSTKGAKGLMQLMPDTARDMGARSVFDPRQNIFAGVRYLRFLLDAFHGNVSLAAAAYNAGPTVVKRFRGVPPYKETQDYVNRVEALLGMRAQSLTPAPALVEALFIVPNDRRLVTFPAAGGRPRRVR